MGCIVCEGKVNLHDLRGSLTTETDRVVKSGYINGIFYPADAYYPPFSNMITVALYPSPVTYLKFQNKGELAKLLPKLEESRQDHSVRIIVKGCRHLYHTMAKRKRSGSGSLMVTEPSEQNRKELLFDVSID